MQANIDPRTHIILSKYHSRSFWIIFHGTGTRSGSIKCDHSLCSVSILITSKSSTLDRSQSLRAPATFSRHFLTGCKPRFPRIATPTGRHTQKLHFPSSLTDCKFRKRMSTWNRGFLWPSLLDLGTLMDSLPPALGSESWHCHLSAYTRTAYISGLRNIPVDKFILKHKAYPLVNSVWRGNASQGHKISFKTTTKTFENISVNLERG